MLTWSLHSLRGFRTTSAPAHSTWQPEQKAENFTNFVGYETHLGVVTSMHQQHWASINGMDNQMQGWGGEDDDLYVRLAFLGLVNCTKHPHGAPFRPSNDEGNVFMAIAENGGHHTRSPFKNRTHRVNHKRSIKYRETGLSPSVASSGGWKQTKYHVSRRSTWDLSTTEALHGFAEIHHIKVKVDKSSLEMCFWKCSRKNETNGKTYTGMKKTFQKDVKLNFQVRQSRLKTPVEAKLSSLNGAVALVLSPPFPTTSYGVPLPLERLPSYFKLIFRQHLTESPSLCLLALKIQLCSKSQVLLGSSMKKIIDGFKSFLDRLQ
ncbi:hypothetical protein ACA910_006819 [Epithemia clementina (nom. ined.)]